MDKKEIMKWLERDCTDFLNCKSGCGIPGYPKEKFTGFYVEVEDLADILHPFLKDIPMPKKVINDESKTKN